MNGLTLWFKLKDTNRYHRLEGILSSIAWDVVDAMEREGFEFIPDGSPTIPPRPTPTPTPN